MPRTPSATIPATTRVRAPCSVPGLGAARERVETTGIVHRGQTGLVNGWRDRLGDGIRRMARRLPSWSETFVVNRMLFESIKSQASSAHWTAGFRPRRTYRWQCARLTRRVGERDAILRRKSPRRILRQRGIWNPERRGTFIRPALAWFFRPHHATDGILHPKIFLRTATPLLRARASAAGWFRYKRLSAVKRSRRKHRRRPPSSVSALAAQLERASHSTRRRAARPRG